MIIDVRKRHPLRDAFSAFCKGYFLVVLSRSATSYNEEEKEKREKERSFCL